MFTRHRPPSVQRTQTASSIKARRQPYRNSVFAFGEKSNEKRHVSLSIGSVALISELSMTPVPPSAHRSQTHQSPRPAARSMQSQQQQLARVWVSKPSVASSPTVHPKDSSFRRQTRPLLKTITVWTLPLRYGYSSSKNPPVKLSLTDV